MEERKKYKNRVPVFGLWTDWNRKGGEGKYGGIGWYRIINPFGKLENCETMGKFTFGTDDRVQIAKEIGEKADVIVCKYVDSYPAANHILTIRDFLGKKLLVDIDDNVFEVHPHNYAYKDAQPGSETQKVFEYFFREADGLICSTDALAEYMRKYNKNIYVLPNTIDEEIWNVPMVKNDTERVRIGWVNGPTHEQDVPVLLPVLREILKKYPQVDFYHIGWQSEDFKSLGGNQKLVWGTKGYEEFPQFLASLGIDILVAPLIDDVFNQGKSNIKWMEGAMCEIPMVCSDVTPYSDSITHGKDGFLARTTKEWIESLGKLIESKELREKVGKAAKKTVLKHYSVEKYLPKYAAMLQNEAKPPKIDVTAVITRRRGESASLAVETLLKQTYKGIKIIQIEDVDGKGQNWAKNQGLARVKTKYVLFSDNDIRWKFDAVRSLHKTLEENPDCSYSFGAYIWNFEGSKERHLQCKEQWSADRLKDLPKGNIVSTMALVKTEDCPVMDESIKRLTDWDLWLTMLGQGKKGIHCGKVTFETVFHKDGVSASKRTSYEEALETLKKKHL